MSIISITYTEEDIKGLAADNDIPFDLAIARAEEWSKHITATAMQLIWQQLESVVIGSEP